MAANPELIKALKEGDFDAFKATLPESISEESAKAMFNQAKSLLEEDGAFSAKIEDDEVPYVGGEGGEGQVDDKSEDEAEDDVDAIVAEIDDYIDGLETGSLEESYDDEAFMAKVIEEDSEIADSLRADLIKLAEEEAIARVDEAISKQERLSRQARMRRMAKFLHAKLKLANARMPSTEQIASRARKMAIATMKAKIAKKPIAEMSAADKERVEKILKKLAGPLDRLTKKLMPRIREIAKLRIQNANAKAKEGTK